MKTQFCCISSLGRDQSRGPSIPSPILKPPLQELCTNPANFILERNLLCLLINIYSDIYQGNMKGKGSICISSITHWETSLNTLGHKHQRAASRSLLLVQGISIGHPYGICSYFCSHSSLQHCPVVAFLPDFRRASSLWFMPASERWGLHAAVWHFFNCWYYGQLLENNTSK